MEEISRRLQTAYVIYTTVYVVTGLPQMLSDPGITDEERKLITNSIDNMIEGIVSHAQYDERFTDVAAYITENKFDLANWAVFTEYMTAFIGQLVGDGSDEDRRSRALEAYISVRTEYESARAEKCAEYNAALRQAERNGTIPPRAPVRTHLDEFLDKGDGV